MEIAITILVIIGVVLVTALVFGGWVIVAFIRLIGRAIGGNGSPARPASLPAPGAQWARCGRTNCRALNPEQARFCRRCGRMLHAPQPATAATARRVAMW